jgi:hypothetical protein
MACAVSGTAPSPPTLTAAPPAIPAAFARPPPRVGRPGLLLGRAGLLSRPSFIGSEKLFCFKGTVA